LLRRIVACAYAFPDKDLHGIEVVDDAKDLITGLLTRNPQQRLGSFANGDDDIKNHPWFGGIFNSDDLVNKKFQAPWKPNIKDEKDASNFDDYSHEEDEMYVSYPDELSAEQQQLFAEF